MTGHPAVCHPTLPIACRWRLRAVAEGTFIWDFERHGWFWRDCRTPGTRWLHCPWCNQPLPPREEMDRRTVRMVEMLREYDGADIYHDEDGG